jgi:hypothetical protein
MPPTPYFDRLSEAYAVIGGIPDHQITLDIEQVSIAQDMVSIGMTEKGYVAPSNRDGLVLPPDIWLSLCPAYIDMVFPLLEHRASYALEAFWRIDGRLTSRFEVAMAHLFNITEEAAEELFGMRGEEETDNRSDKQVFLDRISSYLAQHGQELTVGLGHIEQDEMLEHGISPTVKTTALSDQAGKNTLEAQSTEATTSS